MSDAGTRTAPLGKRWLRKTLIFVVVLVAFGGWGLYDAIVAYPARGERFATWAKLAYLEAAREANQEDFGVFERDASVPTPREEFRRLSEPDQRQRNLADAANTSSNRNLRAVMLNARYDWLEGLSRIGRLDPAYTAFDSPRAELDRMRAELAGVSRPKPLSRWDIPSQWVIMGVCWVIAGYIIVRALKVASIKYRWEPSTMTLTLPGGAGITPADLEEVDKRKWDKFIVFLKIKAGHPSLGGQEVRFDTYQHDELEGWILDMEKAAFGPPEGEEPETGAGEPLPEGPAKADGAASEEAAGSDADQDTDRPAS
ncbi:MAG: hypothetical protein LAT64_12040 [Phycisphaerales bacterium]|nr:hypothetical protein [Planctomycetota bacterium]MCH8509483.1 hypothetical protein [Phycisphaerales bacterium]